MTVDPRLGDIIPWFGWIVNWAFRLFRGFRGFRVHSKHCFLIFWVVRGVKR